ncbi:aminotransferase class V-fold PLP-dependent enzyme [Pelagibacteraceae bacterium]|nr:aminotransferase class V-fold PLP-dependent enzyme [Pelagibacteraceae bacterium]
MFSKNIKYPLIQEPYSNQDISKAITVLKSKQITMSKITNELEKKFAKYVGSKYALMVNSGSSANLLAAFAIVNPRKKGHIKNGGEFLIPALCWSTSLWPLVQAGLKPKFVDVNVDDFNMNITDLKKKINKKTKAIMAVHVLGNSTNMDELKRIVKKKKIFLIEDTCESLGSKFGNKYLGTFGDMGTYSFYVSHQISSGEGGMIVCNSKSDYDLLYSMRSHGWSRKSNKASKKDTSFNFINSGFNLRSTDVSAAIGLNQFKRLNRMIKVRTENRKKIIKKIQSSQSWNNQFSFLKINNKVKPSFFGLPILLDKRYLGKKYKFLGYLKKIGIETRKIISGNFINQESVKLYKFNKSKCMFPNAQEIEDRGFFIGLHPKKISNKELDYLEKNLFKINIL